MHTHSETEKRKMIAAALFVACGVAAVFYPLFGAGFLGLDDNYLITENVSVTRPSLAGAAAAFGSYDPELYIPATFLSYQFDVLVAGLSPFFFHVHNLILHLLCGFFVFLLMKRLSKHALASGFVALLFLLHPIQTEAVLWLSARKDLQSACFALASLLCYVRWLDPSSPSEASPRQGTKRSAWYAGALGLFLVALLSKVSVAVLPLLLVLIDTHEGVTLTKKGIVERSPFWLLSAVFGAIAIAGKTAGLSALPLTFTALIGSQSVLSTIRRLLFPFGLNPLPVLEGWQTLSLASVSAVLIIALLLFGTVILIRRNRSLGLLAAAFFLLLSPSLFTFWKDGVVYLGSDRYAYLAVAPFACMAAMAVGAVLRRLPHGFRRTFAAPVIGLAAGALCMLTFLQAAHWQSDASLFLRTVFLVPQSHVAHMNLGNAYRAAGHSMNAGTEYVQAISIKPDYAPAYRNLGALFVEAGKPESALVYYRHALALSPDSPDGSYGLGVAYLQLPDLARAEREFLATIERSPTFMDAYIALGNVYYIKKDRVKERQMYEAALRIDPTYGPALQNLQILDDETASQ